MHHLLVRLSTEILEHIICLAWITAGSPIRRETLLKRLSATHPFFRTIIRRVARKNAVVDFNPGYADDVTLYRKVLQHYNFDDLRCTRMPSCVHLEVRNFSSKFCAGLGCTSKEDSLKALYIRRRNDVVALLKDIPHDNCKSFSLSIDDSFTRSLTRKEVSVYALPVLFWGVLHSFRALTTMDIDCEWIDGVSDDLHEMDLPTLASVRTLRMKQLPRCSSTGVRGTKELAPCMCLAHTLDTTFPGLRHLILGKALPLACVKEPRTLERLTLEVGVLWDGLEWFRLPKALNAGFMCRGHGGDAFMPVVRKTVVLKMKEEDSKNVKQVQDACEKAGVELIVL